MFCFNLKKTAIVVLLSLLGLNALASEAAQKRAKLNVVNLSSRKVRVQDGEVNFFNCWKSKPSPYYYLETSESRTKKIPYNSCYCVSTDAILGENNKTVGVFEYFNTHHKQYLIFAVGYGAAIYIGNQLGRSLFTKIYMENKDVANGIEQVAKLLSNGNDEAAVEVLLSLKELTSDRELTKLLGSISKKVADGLSEEMRKSLDDQSGSTLVALGIGYLSNEALKKYGPDWLNELYELYPNVTTALVKAAPIFLTKAASALTPKVAALIAAHPYIAAKKVASGFAAYKIWHWYQTSPHADITVKSEPAHAYEAEQEITIYIKDFNQYTICLEKNEY